MSHKNKKSAAAQGAAAVVSTENTSTASTPVVTTAPESAPEVVEEVVVKKDTKVVTSAAKVAFLAPLIAEGKYSAKELSDMALAAFPKMTESTIRTFLTDAKNVKYNKFDKLVVLTAEKKLAFAEEAKAA